MLPTFLSQTLSTRSCFLLIAVFLLTLHSNVRAIDGTVDETFIAGINIDQAVNETAFQSDNKLIVVGAFSSIAGYPSRGIVRLDTNGNIDQTFRSGTGVDGGVIHVIVLPNDDMLIFGAFSSYNGTPVTGMAKLRSDGSLDPSWPNGSGVDGFVSAVAQDSAGRLVIAGSFSTVNGVSRSLMARLDAAGNLDFGFVVTTPVIKYGYIYTVEILPDGKVMVGGSFSYGITRLNSDGSYDNFFQIITVNTPVKKIKQTPFGIYVAGNFTGIGGYYMPGIARLKGANVDTTFYAPTANDISDFAVQPDGKVIVTGLLGNQSYYAARLYPDGSEEPGYLGAGSLTYNSTVAASVTLDAAGNAYLGGLLGDQWNSVPNGSMVRAPIMKFDPAGTRVSNYVTRTAGILSGADLLNVYPDGRYVLWAKRRAPQLERRSSEGFLDTTYAPTTNYYRVAAFASDGSVFIGDKFTNIFSPFYIDRVTPEGVMDPNFSASGTPNQSTNEQVYKMAVQPDGKLIAVGMFTAMNGVQRNHIARLMPDGSTDPTFVVGIPSYSIENVLVGPTGRVFIVSKRNIYSSKTYLYELNISDGSVIWECSFDPPQDYGGNIRALALLDDGSILAGGYFTKVNGIDAPYLARILPGGVPDPNFHSPTLGRPEIVMYNMPLIESILQLNDGRIMVGGQFSSINGFATKNLVRLFSDGSLDSSFKTNVIFNYQDHGGGPVRSMAQQPDGRLIISGSLSGVNASVKDGIARFQPFNSLYTIAGRVTTPTGQGLRNAAVTMTDPLSNISRTVITGSLGYYSFTSVPSQMTYSIGVRSKRYRFSDRQLTVDGNLTDVDFVGVE